MTTASVEQLERDRSVAIAESGWGEEFRFFQPRNLAFWVLSLWVLIGAFLQISDISGQVGYYAPALAVALVVFTIYGLIFWWFTVRIDRYSSLPAGLIVAGFLYGGLAATWVMAARANDVMLPLWSKLVSPDFAAEWGAGLTAPFTEEIAKGAGLLLLIALAPRLIRTAFDGFIAGAFIGLGFQLFEDVQYVMTAASTTFGVDQIGATVSTFVTRLTSGVAAHILYSAVFCAGLAYFIGLPAEPRRRLRGVLLMLSAMLLHGLWDAAAGFGSLAPLLTILDWIVVIVGSLLIVTMVFKMTVPKEREFLRTLLAPEVASGVLLQEELDAAAGNRRDRQRFIRKSAKGKPTRRRAKHILEATFDLADEVARSGGTESKRLQFARAELVRIRG